MYGVEHAGCLAVVLKITVHNNICMPNEKKNTTKIHVEKKSDTYIRDRKITSTYIHIHISTDHPLIISLLNKHMTTFATIMIHF